MGISRLSVKKRMPSPLTPFSTQSQSQSTFLILPCRNNRNGTFIKKHSVSRFSFLTPSLFSCFHLFPVQRLLKGLRLFFPVNQFIQSHFPDITNPPARDPAKSYYVLACWDCKKISLITPSRTAASSKESSSIKSTVRSWPLT